ncbi:MAG: CHC2 zinc finger domain-containing protein [Novosphingobium sp.]
MARIPDAEIERLKSEVSLVRLVESSGVKLVKRGADMVGCCPFHDDGTPSLSVSAAKNLFRCFGCDAGGGPIRLRCGRRADRLGDETRGRELPSCGRTAARRRADRHVGRTGEDLDGAQAGCSGRLRCR